MDDNCLSINGLKIGIATAADIIPVVAGVSFAIKPGKTFALLGESGCGKSLTALAIMQLLPPAAWIMGDSQILYHGKDLLELSEVKMRDYRGAKIAMIFQEPMTSLNPVLTVGAQISEVLHCHRKLTHHQVRPRSIELLKAVGTPNPSALLHAYPHQLSGGMKQRVMIAIALAGEPEILIADEPTTALDVTIQSQILHLLKELQHKTGMGILLITHDLGVVADTADEVGVMYAGHIVEQADTADLFNKPLHPYIQQLFAAIPDVNKRSQRLANIPGQVPLLLDVMDQCRFVTRCEYAQAACQRIIPRWLQAMPEHHVRCHLYDKSIDMSGATIPLTQPAEVPQKPIAANKAESLFEVNQVKVYFPIQKGLLKRTIGYVKAVDGVTLTLRAGQTLALVGESGCGKTTLGKCMLQLIKATGGSITYNGNDLLRMRQRQLGMLRREVQFIFQDPFAAMDPRMMIIDIIAEGLMVQGICKNQKEKEQRVDQLLTAVGLSTTIKHRYPHEFSGGQRQRICIARALAVKPKIIICDEPTSALDVSIQAQILNLLKDLQREFGLSYLFISHNISAVSYLADEIAVMYLGRIVERGSTKEILTAPKHPYTQALLAAVPSIDITHKKEYIQLPGEIPSPSNPPQGCHFHPRCPFVMPKCREQYPDPTQLSITESVSCWLYEKKL